MTNDQIKDALRRWSNRTMQDVIKYSGDTAAIAAVNYLLSVLPPDTKQAYWELPIWRLWRLYAGE